MGIVLENGYEMQTTFWSDFTIADALGIDAIRDTYQRAFNEWKTNCKYITELSMVLNWKLFEWYNKDENCEQWKLYQRLYMQTDTWCMDNLKGEDLEYYIKTTD